MEVQWRKLLLVVGALALVLAAVALLGFRLQAAKDRSACFANERMIEDAARAYAGNSPDHALADLNGPITGSHALLGGTPHTYLLAAPHCPGRPNAPYILLDGKTDCPVHGHY